MKAFLTAALTLAMLTGGALAQAAVPLPAPAGMAPAPAAPPPVGTRVPPPPPSGPAFADEGGSGAAPPEGARGHHPPPPPPPPSKSAHIHLQHGDMMLDVKCADDEPMTSCADLTLKMLDRLQGPKN